MADDSIKVLEKTKQVATEITPELQKQLDILTKISKNNTDILRDESERLRLARKQIESNEKTLDLEKQELLLRQEKLDQDKLLIKKHEEEENYDAKHLAAQKKALEGGTESYKQAVKEFKLKEKQLKQQQEGLAAMDGLEDSTENLIGNLTGINSNWKKSFFGQLSQASATGGWRDAFSKVGAGIKKTITPTNMINSAFQKVQESTILLIKSQDDALSSFNKATGAAGKYDEVITDVGAENRTLGIDVKDATEAVKALKHEFTDFTMLTKESQKELATFSATMNEFGVSNESTAKNVQFMTKSMGLSTTGAMTAQKEIAATAKKLGVSIGEMSDQFTQAQPILAQFGSSAVRVFRETSSFAKTTGIEINRLLGMIEEFDTFEGAATKVGKLNAILGGAFFDSIEMLQAEGVDKMVLLRQGIEASGVSLDQMNRHQLKALASAGGFKDAAELQNFMSGSLEKSSAAARANALSQEEMAKMAKKAQSMTEKLQQIVMSFALRLEPLVNWVKEGADAFLAFSDASKGVIPIFITMLAVGHTLYKFLVMFRGVQTALRGTTLAMSAAQAGATAAQLSKAAADVTSSAAALENAAATVMQNLAIEGSGKVAKKASPALLYWALIIGVVGTVATALTYAFSALIDSLSSFFKMLLANSDKLFKFAAQLTVLSLAMVAVGLGAIVAAPALAILSGGLMLLSFSLALIKTEDLQALGNMFMGISKVSFQTAGALFVVAEAIRQIADALDEVPERKAIAFAATMHSTTRTPTAAAAQNTGASRGSGGGGQQSTIRQPIIIELDGRQLGKYILEVVSDEIAKQRG